MRRWGTLPLLFALLTAVASMGGRVEAASPAPKVLRDVEVGVHRLEVVPPQQKDTAVEPSITVNPNNPLNAVALYQAGRVDAGCAQVNGYATTFDGGKTWTSGVLPRLTTVNGGPVPLASDPVVAFGPDNVVYANSLMCDGNFNDLAVSVSTNGGRSWAPPIMVPTERTFPLDDKNWITVDNGKGPGHHPGRLYLVWDNVAPVVAMYSDDRARTWHGPFVVWPGQGIGSVPIVMPNGDLAVVFQGIFPIPPLLTDGTIDPRDLTFVDRFVVATAPAAGRLPTGAPLLFGPPTAVASYRGTDSRLQRAAENLPTADVNPRTGRIHVAWSDNRFRADVTNDIVITHSDDGGLTWSPVERVNPGRTDDHVEHFTAAIAVGEDGVVRLMYRRQPQEARAEDIPRYSPYVDTYYQQSTDDGESFTKPLKVNRRVRTDIRFASYSRESAFLGDYNQIAVAGSWAYVIRTEAYRLSRGEPAEWPPAVHHQRAWVAVVDGDGNGRP